MSHYPRWVHHKEHKDKLVKSAIEHQALGEGWGDCSSVWRIQESEAVVQEEQSEQAEPVQELPKAQAEESKQKGKKGRKQSA